MGPRESILPHRIFPLLLLGAVGFSLFFIMARRQSMESSLRWGESLLQQSAIHWGHGDEMALIDWGKGLEEKGPLAFRVTGSPGGPGERTLVEGGALQKLGSNDPGVTLEPFSTWVHLVLKSSGPGPTLQLALTHPAEYPPWAWGLLGSFMTFMGFLFGIRSNTIRAGEKRAEEGGPTLTAPLPKEGHSLQPGEGAWILLDQGFSILRVSPLALDQLGFPLEGTMPTHLLDLTPAPELMPSFLKSDQGEMAGAFPTHPDLRTEWTQQPEGTLLLVLTRVSERPKTH